MQAVFFFIAEAAALCVLWLWFIQRLRPVAAPPPSGHQAATFAAVAFAAALLAAACSTTYTPEPEPLLTPAPAPYAPSPGAGALGQLAVPIPGSVGPITAWTTASFVSITSALPSAIVPGDSYSLWGSATGVGSTNAALCLDAGSPCPVFIAAGTVSPSGALTWSTQPPTWQAWGFYSVQRDAGSGSARTLYINGNLGSTSSTSDGGGAGGVVDQGRPNAGGVDAWPVIASQGPPGDGGPWPVTIDPDDVVLVQDELLDQSIRNPGFDPASVLGVQGAIGMIPLVVSGSTYTSVTSGGTLVASQLLKSTSGTHYSTTAVLNPSSGSGTFYVQLVAAIASACPTSGAVTFIHAPVQLIADGTNPVRAVFDDTPNGIPIPSGACVVVSTTQSTLTLGAAALLVDGSVL